MVDLPAICAIALIVEATFGYPNWLVRSVGHPVTWAGAALSFFDRRLNRECTPSSARQVWGAVALLTLCATAGLLCIGVSHVVTAMFPPTFTILLLGVLASTCIAQRSLDAHVRAVADALEWNGLAAARRAVGKIVGRDTDSLDEAGVARAAIESLGENFADGIVAPTFWLLLLGLPGGIVYKVINTADSMIGHRTPRHEAFGFAAAKVDDAVNWVPARLAAIWIVLAAALVPGASAGRAWRVMRRDAHGHPSPNAGWPEAAMAGALDLRLGGPRLYVGRTVDDAFIGDGDRPADAPAIRSALHVYRVACGLETAAVIGLTLLIGRWP